MESVLGKDYHNDFYEIKVELKLDISFYDYFNKCFKANTLAAKKKKFFLNFMKGGISTGT